MDNDLPGNLAPDDESGSPKLDPSVAHVARVYDYWLGGSSLYAHPNGIG